MKQFIHTPQHMKTNRILPGHGQSSSPRTDALPGVDRAERQARRYGWTNHQASRRRAYGWGSSFGLLGAILALALMALTATGPNESIFDRPAEASVVQVSETAPQTADAPVWRG